MTVETVTRFMSIFPQDDMIAFANYVFEQSHDRETHEALMKFGKVEIMNMLCEWCADNRKYRLS